MDAIDILGELLGHKSSKPSRGTDVLKDIFGRKSRGSTAPTAPPKKPSDIKREAEELEDLLNVSNNRRSQRGSSQPQRRPQPSPPVQRQPQSNANSGFDTFNRSDNEKAEFLVRAMVNAAKADGRIDKSEQNKIIEKMGNTSRENIDFLRQLFNEPLDVQAFVRSVPVGMEQQVYMISLIAIDLDEASEAKYLMDLSQGLRIPDDTREQIHQRLGAPSVY